MDYHTKTRRKVSPSLLERVQLSLTSKAAYTEVLLCPGGYSSSASAKAVRLEGDQLTGFLPRKMCPSVNILPNTCVAVPCRFRREEEG